MTSVLPSRPRDIAREAVRSHVLDTAIGLFVEHGYVETSVDEICERAGISRSTFFRHFSGKAGLLEVNAGRFGERVAQALAARSDSEPLWVALRRSLDPLVTAYAKQPQALAFARVVVTTPGLHIGTDAKLAEWLPLLRPEVARRCGVAEGDTTDPRPAAVIAALVGAIHAAMNTWAVGNGSPDLDALFDESISVFS